MKYALHALEWEAKEKRPLDLRGWNLNIENVEVLYVYGFHESAYEYLLPWLRENVERRLIFLEDDTGILARGLYLEDPQVEVEWLHGDILQELAERYPAKCIEVIGLPGKQTRKLRLQLLRRTTLSHALFIDRLHGYQPFQNFVLNLPHTKHAFYANRLRFPNVPAIICGAGPSLQKDIETLRSLENKALIIAGGSAIAALSSVGIIPHFAMAIDPNLEEYRRLRNSFAFECPFLFSTRLFPGVFRTCNGPFGYMRTGIGGACELWLEEELGLTDPLIGEHLSDESISVTAICQAFAQHVGCNPIIFTGVDLAYTDGQRYAAGVSDEETKFKEIDDKKSAADRILRRKDKQGNWVHTAVRWMMEGKSLAHYAKKHPEIEWVNATQGGLRIKGMKEGRLEDMKFGELDLRKLVREQIAMHPMPKAEKDLLGELKESLERMMGYLEVLAGQKRGSGPLAELEMKEELVASILFYDMDKVLKQSRKEKWNTYLEIAKKYLQMLHKF